MEAKTTGPHFFLRRHFQTHFLERKKYEFQLKFHWSLFLRVQLTISEPWFRQWLGAEQATSHYLNQWWPSLLTHICVARLNELISDTCISFIGWLTWPTMFHIMACCLTAPSHYLSQCDLSTPVFRLRGQTSFDNMVAGLDASALFTNMV